MERTPAHYNHSEEKTSIKFVQHISELFSAGQRWLKYPVLSAYTLGSVLISACNTDINPNIMTPNPIITRGHEAMTALTVTEEQAVNDTLSTLDLVEKIFEPEDTQLEQYIRALRTGGARTIVSLSSLQIGQVDQLGHTKYYLRTFLNSDGIQQGHAYLGAIIERNNEGKLVSYITELTVNENNRIIPEQPSDFIPNLGLVDGEIIADDTFDDPRSTKTMEELVSQVKEISPQLIEHASSWNNRANMHDSTMSDSIDMIVKGFHGDENITVHLIFSASGKLRVELRYLENQSSKTVVDPNRPQKVPLPYHMPQHPSLTPQPLPRNGVPILEGYSSISM